MEAAEDTKNAPDLQCLPSLCRGLYNRVAQKLGCDPSYVSRVARGESSFGGASRGNPANVGDGKYWFRERIRQKT
jgi:hypothetical protein